MNSKLLKVLLVVLVSGVMSCDSPKTSATTSKVTQEISSSEMKDPAVEVDKKRKTVLFFGDSLTAGFGLDEDESFSALIQNRIDSLGLAYEVINAGLSGETTAGGKGRIAWVLNQPIDIFVLELGANDMLRGLDLDETIKNLKNIVEVYRDKNPDGKVIIAGMQAPPNMGNTYTTRFKGIFEELAKEYEAGLIPFLLDGVAGIPSLNLEDGKHPTAEGQKVVRENVWKVLKPYLI